MEDLLERPMAKKPASSGSDFLLRQIIDDAARLAREWEAEKERLEELESGGKDQPKFHVVVDKDTKDLVQDVTRYVQRLIGKRRLPEQVIMRMAATLRLKEMLAVLKAAPRLDRDSD